MERVVVTAPDAPAAVAAYSHAVRAGELLFCSGQIALDPASGELVGDAAAEQATRCLRNLEAVCRAAGASLARAARLTVLLADIASFAEVDEAYAAFFADRALDGPPARITYAVAGLPRGALVEIDAVVAL